MNDKQIGKSDVSSGQSNFLITKQKQADYEVVPEARGASVERLDTGRNIVPRLPFKQEVEKVAQEDIKK